VSIRFSADDIFEIAEKMEQNAAVFYHKAGDKVDYPGARQLLRDLAAWEEKHERFFAELRKQLAGMEKADTTFDPYDEGVQYLQALADHSVYKLSDDPIATLGEHPSFEAILSFAIDREKDAVTFYSGIKAMVPESLGQDKLDGIVEEEKRHVTMLTNELVKVRT